MPEVPKIVSLQYLRNGLLEYLDFEYGHRPSHTQIMQKKNLRYIENGVLEHHDFQHPDRPQ